MNQEPLYNWTVTIVLPDGSVHKAKELAYTKWHAVDKAIIKYAKWQPNRKQYSATKTVNFIVQ